MGDAEGDLADNDSLVRSQNLVAPYDVRRAMVVKCQARTERRVQALPWADRGVINTSVMRRRRRPRLARTSADFPSRAPSVTPTLASSCSSSALHSGQLGVTTTAPEGLILPSHADACSPHTTKKKQALSWPSNSRHVRARPSCSLSTLPKNRGRRAARFCSRGAKAALKSERTSGSLRKQTKASVSPPAALETRRQSLQAHASLKLQTPLAASTTSVRCCDTSPFWRWPMPFTLPRPHGATESKGRRRRREGNARLRRRVGRGQGQGGPKNRAVAVGRRRRPPLPEGLVRRGVFVSRRCPEGVRRGDASALAV